MAKKEKNTGYRGVAYVVAAIALALIMMLNMTLLDYSYGNANKTYARTSNEGTQLSSSSGQLAAIQEQVMEIIAGVGIMPAHYGQISSLFPDIQENFDKYEESNKENAYALRRVQHTRAYINAYYNKIMPPIKEMQDLYSAGDTDALNAKVEEFSQMYTSEVAPLQIAWQQMLIAATNINSRIAAERTTKLTNTVYMLDILLLVILILGEIAIFIVARINKRAAEELSRKTAQFADASSKLMRSREKMEDIAVSNILTGLKNRYALEQDIGERLANEQFNIAVFDLDNFRSINDTYGYDFGDEYLAQIAERLKTEFEQFADIYNITGNEFCFVFNRTVSDTQVIRIIENIVQVMTAPYTIMNLTVQLTVSGSTYHYLAGDCLNVNSLLVKMDNVLRNAKRSGGGQILQVMNI